MRLLPALQASVARFRRLSTWAAVLGFGGLWATVRMLAGQPFGRMGLGEFLVPAILVAGHLAFDPVPWQWSGKTPGPPSLWRGWLQAIPWNTAWLLVAMLGLKGFFPPDPPRRPEAARTHAEEEAQRPPRHREEDPPPRRDDDRLRRPEPPRTDTALLARTYPVKRQEFIVFLLNLPFSLILGWFLAEKEGAEARSAEAESKAQAARALALQAQLHPHALYNVLSGLTELVHEDADAAEEALVEMVELLRMLTRQGHAHTLPLAQERALVKHYLTIEAIRLGPRLRVAWEWPAWADRLEVPPLLLQPLVENAVAHGIAAHPEGGDLRISIARFDGRIRLRVANTGCPLEAIEKEGTGLGNLRERLALMPHLNPTFTLRSDLGWTLAEVTLGINLDP